MSPDPLLKISEDIGYIKASQDTIQGDISEMKVTLKDGHVKMNGLRNDVDKVTGTLNIHINDSEAHHKVPSNPGTKGRIVEHRLKIIASLFVILAAVIGHYFGG